MLGSHRGREYLSFFLGLLVSLSVAECGTSEPSNPWPTGDPWPTELPQNAEDGDHAQGKPAPFFEGWYHKVSLPQQNESFFFIYGLAMPDDTASDAFIYCGRSSTLETTYQTFSKELYSSEKGHRDVRIGDSNRATARRIAGRSQGQGHSCSWDIVFEQGIPWEKTMGWLSDLGGMETSWAVGTIAAKASGWIRFDDQLYEFQQTPGYGDHNWGKNFPSEWIWLQANHFTNADTAIALSGGKVPLGAKTIDAYMVGLRHQGEMHTFRTQDSDTFTVMATKVSWQVDAQNSDKLERLTVTASCAPETLFHLLVPTQTGMQPHAWESLEGQVEIVLETRASDADPWQEVLRDQSDLAGVELGE